MDTIRVNGWDDAKRVVVQLGWWQSVDGVTKINSLGTGVILDAVHVATAEHILAEIDRQGMLPAVVAADRDFQLGQWRGEVRQVASRRTFDGTDLTVLELTRPLDAVGLAYPLAAVEPTAEAPPVGGVVDAYGCPSTQLLNGEGGQLIVFPGLLHLRRHVQESNDRHILATYPNQHGFSGGPLFDAEGRLVGVASMSVADAGRTLAPNVYLTGCALYERVSPLV